MVHTVGQIPYLVGYIDPHPLSLRGLQVKPQLRWVRHGSGPRMRHSADGRNAQDVGCH